MTKEKVNREAMYRVFKSLWYTKKEVNFVAIKEGGILVRVSNMPVEYMDRDMALKVGNVIGEVLAIDW
ncbi:hypothetical protein Goshw_007745 [Gossypium schwendimanii]|uniref:Uncharacterized protein n=1 Tax=Gossypium schwendimanii TaxID=34291 RepID=A0A7J9MYH5_GOSSC|nr:hypothetical protein [Gossypium schwendimanii]